MIVPFNGFPKSSVTLTLIVNALPAATVSGVIKVMIAFLSAFHSALFLLIFPFTASFPVLLFAIKILFLIVLFSVVFKSIA